MREYRMFCMQRSDRWRGVRQGSLKAGIVLILFCASWAHSDTEQANNPVREMLLAHFETVQGNYRRMVKSLTLPSDLGLSQADLRPH